MRISVREDDAAFSLRAFYAHVYLNGVRLQYCFTADEERGEAWVYATDDAGLPLVDEDKKSFVAKLLTGAVRIVFESEPGHG